MALSKLLLRVSRGVLTAVVEGRRATDLVATLLREGLVSRANHAAYLGRELTLAEKALQAGTSYIQDAAPGEERDRYAERDA